MAQAAAEQKGERHHTGVNTTRDSRSGFVRSRRADLDDALKRNGSKYLNRTHVVCSDHFVEKDFRNKNFLSQGSSMVSAAMGSHIKTGCSLLRLSQTLGLCTSRQASTAGGIKKTTQLKNLLASPQLSFLMEAHSGLSARIVEEAGFSGIWGSGLAISAQLGVRDSNEASWTQVLEVVEFMADATDIPILLDADTGYGNFNNARRLVRKLEDRGVAGCCIEDKCFPKTNSLLDGRLQPLADAQEFALKIKACKDHQKDPDFCVVARVEAFIAGWGVDVALERAQIYREAGADAVLIHSKKSDPSEIEAFVGKWKNKGPVVIVPTKYYTTPTSKFQELGISTVIWANHNMRASVTAMQNVSRQIMKDQSLVNIETQVASVKEVFRLQRDEELKAAEDRYLPKK